MNKQTRAPWPKQKLDTVCESISDGDHQAPPQVDSGVPFITISNFDQQNGIDFSNTKFVPEEYYNALDPKRKARPGDVLYSVVGSFGIPVLVKNDRPFAFQRHIAILRPNHSLMPEFLFYSMKTPAFFHQADGAAVGAAQRTIGLSSLRGFTISLPPLSEQRRIVGILSAYDDLIENNRKRIALLEESARSLYKEWFVRLRFPGHERVPVEGGVPKGWKRTTVGEVCEVLYGKAHADIPDGDIPIVGSGGIMRKGNKALCNESSVLIPRKGTLGNVMLMEEPFWVVDTMFYTRMKLPNMVRWLYYSIQDMKLEERATGTAIPSMTTAILNPLPLRLPSAEVLSEFSDWTNPLFTQIKTLRRDSEKLTAARDALLPRLMKGDKTWK